MKNYKTTLKNYKTTLTLPAPEMGESLDCRTRIFNLIDQLNQQKQIAQDTGQFEYQRDCAIHTIKHLTTRLLWELNG